VRKKRTAEKRYSKNKKIGAWHGFQFAMTVCPVLCALFFSNPAYAVSDTQTIPLTFYIEPVRVVRAESSNGGPSVDLGSVVPGVEVPSQSVQVAIVTNTESPYSVYHELRNEMTNQSGALLPDESFRYRVTNGTQGTESLVSSWAAVPEGRSVIARGRGGADRFTIDYLVQGKKVLEAGDYYGNAKITVEDA
jgi:hypothetical protein